MTILQIIRLRELSEDVIFMEENVRHYCACNFCLEEYSDMKAELSELWNQIFSVN